MGTGRIVKSYACPYCGRSFNDDRWTYDHIIAQDIGGPRGFKIISCEECNGEIGRNIERRALQTPTIRNYLGRVMLDGHKIHFRRKKTLIPEYNGVGLAAGRPARMYFDFENRSHRLTFLSDTIPDERHLQHGVAIFPVDKENEQDIEALTAMSTKIGLGACFWLWKNDFVELKCAKEFRETLWNTKNEKITKMSPNEQHLSWAPKGEGIAEKVTENDAHSSDVLDNGPNHTIGIFQTTSGIMTIVNLFGAYESMTIAPSMDCGSLFGDDSGRIIMCNIDRNVTTLFTLAEYVKMKKKHLGDSFEIAEFGDVVSQE